MASVSVLVGVEEEPLELLVVETKRDSGGTSDGLIGEDVGAQLGRVSLVSISLGAGAANLGASTDDTSVDAARDAVLELNVDLGESELFSFVGGVLLDISTGRAVNHLSHLEALDGLVLRHNPAAVDASNHVGVTLVLLSSSVVSSL